MTPDPQQLLVDEHSPESGEDTPTPRYASTPTGIVRLVLDKNGQLRDQPLSNFDAKIVRALVLDDGEENGTFFDIDVTVKGRGYEVRNLPAAEFESLSWVVPSTRGRGTIEPGRGTREALRHAIQVLSVNYLEETHFGHTGWRRIGSQWVYLHAGGGIGPNGPVSGVTVALDGPLGLFRLPDPVARRSDLVEAVRASVRLLSAGPGRLTAPLFCLVYRGAIDASDFSVHVVGPTGSGKSVVCSLSQQHFGADLDYNHTPASWTSTANANEALRFKAKDAILLIDDLAPDTASRAAIDRTFRGQANGSGRDRMRPDGTLRPTKRPRGTLLSTGEDNPLNHSAIARTLVLRQGRADLDWRAVTECQRDAGDGLYALALSGFVQWLAPRLGEVRLGRARRVQQLRADLADPSSHRRTPAIIAELVFGLETWVEFATEVGALTAAEAADCVQRVIDGVTEAADAQSAVQRDADPVTRFRDLVRGAIAGGRAHAASTTGMMPTSSATWGWQSGNANGTRVGWVDGEHLYLDPVNAYSVAVELAAAMNVVLPGERMLWSAMRERGLLQSVDEAGETNRIRRTVQGKEQRVLHLSTSFVTGDPDAAPPPGDPTLT